MRVSELLKAVAGRHRFRPNAFSIDLIFSHLTEIFFWCVRFVGRMFMCTRELYACICPYRRCILKVEEEEDEGKKIAYIEL